MTHINIKQLFHLIGQSREYSMGKSENSTEISNCTHKLLNMHLDTRRNLDCHPFVFAMRRAASARQLKLFHLVKDFQEEKNVNVKVKHLFVVYLARM